jgi:dipeptidase D
LTRPLDGLEPALLWERFFELTQIARPPKEEGPVREHVLAWAAERRLDARVDGAGNVVAAVPATPGREPAQPVALQAHLDMVCERDPDTPYDPREGCIGVVVDGDWVAADGTTLGADNGIGVAAAMAIAEDGLEHGPLELVFTVSEEQGLDGAKALDPSLVASRRLVNLDGTSDDAITVGCAGSDHTFLRLALAPTPVSPDEVVLQASLSGARGGHSGADIDKGRVNAIKALGAALSSALDEAPFRLVSLAGGVSRNAIPRDAHAIVALSAARVDAFRSAFAAQQDALRRRFPGVDDAMTLDAGDAEATAAADPETTRRALDLVAALPTGVLALAPGLPGVVETSISLTVAGTNEGTLTLASMARSSNARALDELLVTARSLARLSGAELEIRRSYPPWEPKLDSSLLRTAEQTYASSFGAQPALAVVHGGLECAVLGERLPGVEMISIGPEIVGPHAPGEKVRISSAQRFYRLLAGLLDELSS